MGPPIWGRGAAVEMFPAAVRSIRPPHRGRAAAVVMFSATVGANGPPQNDMSFPSGGRFSPLSIKLVPPDQVPSKFQPQHGLRNTS